jgi:hypothetical protein
MVGVAGIWYTIVETKQLSLEQLDVVFHSSNPKETSFQLLREIKARAKAERNAESRLSA